jgi:hypothetical protein
MVDFGVSIIDWSANLTWSENKWVGYGSNLFDQNQVGFGSTQPFNYVFWNNFIIRHKLKLKYILIIY